MRPKGAGLSMIVIRAIFWDGAFEPREWLLAYGPPVKVERRRAPTGDRGVSNFCAECVGRHMISACGGGPSLTVVGELFPIMGPRDVLDSRRFTGYERAGQS